MSEFIVDDGIEVQGFPWGETSVSELRPGVSTVTLEYVAPNQVWMRKAKVDAEEVEGQLVIYRARLLPFLKPRVEIAIP